MVNVFVKDIIIKRLIDEFTAHEGNRPPVRPPHVPAERWQDRYPHVRLVFHIRLADRDNLYINHVAAVHFSSTCSGQSITCIHPVIQSESSSLRRTGWSAWRPGPMLLFNQRRTFRSAKAQCVYLSNNSKAMKYNPPQLLLPQTGWNILTCVVFEKEWDISLSDLEPENGREADGNTVLQACNLLDMLPQR